MTTAAASSKLYEDPIPFAEALPLKGDGDVVFDGNGPKAYTVGYKNYYDPEAPSAPADPMAECLKEATVIENLGWVCK